MLRTEPALPCMPRQEAHGIKTVIHIPPHSMVKTTGHWHSCLSQLPILPELPENIKKYAYVFPENTTTTWSYNENTSIVRTDFVIDTKVKEGTESNLLIGLLPHHWAHLSSDSPVPDKYSYNHVRGEIKTMEGNRFSVENTFHGILPTLPYVNNYSPGFDSALLVEKIDSIKYDQIGTWTDSYNDGQLLNRLVQTARIAYETGYTSAGDIMLATIQERLEDWLKAEEGEVAFLFYYNSTWSALLGYPAGHGQDSNLNDHHFHWGYLIHAAAFMEQYRPGWAAQWGEMVNMLIRDAAATDRNDSMFPFLRNFSPYAGHSWANGFASFPQGNDQESTSESMQFNSSLIHWGTVTGNKSIRDLGIYLYTTEQTAIEEYWFDMYDRIFKLTQPTQQYSLVSRVFGNSFDNGTFWTTDIAAAYGIELYPIHAGSLYLGHNIEYAAKLWEEIKRNTGITRNEANPDLWHDIMWQFASFIDPAEAIAMHDSYPGRELKFGVSDALTYHWIHAMNALGQIDTGITADYPVAAAFNLNGRITYVAHNYNNSTLNVKFSDGYILHVPAREMAFASAGSAYPLVTITAPANNSKLLPGQPLSITAAVTDFSGLEIKNVDFYQNDQLIGSTTTTPYNISWTPEKGDYVLTVKATNTEGLTGTSRPVNISVSNEGACTEESAEASQGAFSKGYRSSFETVGTSVNISFELLDTDKEGVIAYLWNEAPFYETQMADAGGNKFNITLSGQEPGSTISVGCKFAYAGGMSVTRYISYEVGQNCEISVHVENVRDSEFIVYPNPASNIIHIKGIDGNLPHTISIYNLLGIKVLEVYNTGSVDISSLIPNYYIIKAETSKGIFETHKLNKVSSNPDF